MHQKQIGKLLQVIAGSILFPVAVVYFINPEGLNSGGFVGLCQILNTLIPGNHMDYTGIFNFFINIPLFILAYRKLTRRFFFKTILSLVIQSFLLSALPVPAAAVMEDTLSNALAGGVIAGAGIGLCLRGAGSAGGLDILGVYLSKIRPEFSVGKLSYMINFVVLSISAYMTNIRIALYSVIFIMITYFVSDKIHIQNIANICLIFTSNSRIKYQIMEELTRGVTYWDGKGAYTDHRQEILVTVVNAYEVRFVKEILKQNDPKAFLLVLPGRPARGNFEKRPVM